MSLSAAFSGDEVWFLVSFYTHFSPNQTKIKLKIKESRNLLWCLAGQNGNLTETTNGGKFFVITYFMSNTGSTFYGFST